MDDNNFTINNSRIIVPICAQCTEGRCPYNYTAHIVEDNNIYTRIECDSFSYDDEDE